MSDRLIEGHVPTSVPRADVATALELCLALARHLTEANSSLMALSRGSRGEAAEVPDLSVIIPVFNEESNLGPLYTRLTDTLRAEAGLTYEIIFVDDGSRDASLALMLSMSRKDDRVVVVELARNFGHQAAFGAGLDHSRGRAVVLMDADLQDPPELLPVFLHEWRMGHQVVYGIREKRKENWLKRSAYAVYYHLYQKTAEIPVPLSAGDFCLMDRRVVDILVSLPERNRFIRGLRSWTGFSQVGVAYDRPPRHSGSPGYTLARLFNLAIDGLTGFSFAPLRAITAFGMLTALGSLLLAVFYAVKKLTYGLNPPGFATIVVALFWFAGVQLLAAGVIGEYVARIYEEVKHRPRYVVRRITRISQSCEF